MKKGSFSIVLVGLVVVSLALGACKKLSKNKMKVTTARYHHENGPAAITDTVKVKRVRKLK